MRKKVLNGLAALLVIGIGWPYPSVAAESTSVGTLSFIFENDLFSERDRHYTNGTSLTWTPGKGAAAPGWALRLARLLPWFPEQGEIRHGYALGQSMFTPEDINTSNPPLSDRPYAGWLYGTISLGVKSGGRLDQFWLTIGMVGPASLAEQSQKVMHDIVGMDDPQGWDTQLRNEPGLVAGWQRSWRSLAETTILRNRLDLTSHAGGSIGNVFTYGNAGVTLRYGKSLPDDYGPPRIQPGIPGSVNFSAVSRFGGYVFGGVEGRVVARNIFLDGNTFRDSRSVDKEPLVGDLQLGAVLHWSEIRLSYTHVLRTREFESQEESDQFGAFTMGVAF